MQFVLEVNALADLRVKLKFALDHVRGKKYFLERLNKQLIISLDQVIFLYIFHPISRLILVRIYFLSRAILRDVRYIILHVSVKYKIIVVSKNLEYKI